MESFADLKTPSGFPMPDLPKRTESRTLPNDCQETDVDKCVQKIILQKDWTTKVYDKDAIKEWTTKWWSCSEKAEGILRYAVDECRWRQEQWRNLAGTPVAICKAGLVLSKDNVSETLRFAMVADMNKLQQDQEETSKTTMAVHPKYKKLLHLVHPSMYAYEKGVTHILPGIGAEAVASPAWNSFLGFSGTVNNDQSVRPDTEGLRNDSLYGNPYHHSDVDPPTASECSTFQWLPSEFFVSSEASKDAKSICHINSYINNLHPDKYKSLYNKIGELFLEALPLMEEVLSEVNDEGKVRKQLSRFKSEERPSRYWRPWMKRPPQEETKLVEPPIPEFSPLKYSSKRQPVNLHDRPLQVIVKLISMDLQPLPVEKPDIDSMTSEQLRDYFRDPPNYFAGGHWHVEGTLDERIVASACCYLESENIKEEGLHFRDGSVGSGGDELGAAETFAGRILVWPNYLHHKTGRVQLVDDERPGRRTLCCFHLVDPTLRVRSTATVPPQQQSWVNQEVVEVALASFESDGLIHSAIKESLWPNDGSVINYEQALERRQRLSKERSADYHVISDNFWIPCD